MIGTIFDPALSYNVSRIEIIWGSIIEKDKVIYIDGVKYIIKEEFDNIEKLEALLAKMVAKIIKRGKSNDW